MTVRPPLVTVTPYGRAGASSRVRVFGWLDHLGWDAESHSYVGGATNRPRTLVRRPEAVVRAEADLRRLPPTLPGRSLLLSKQASPFSNGRLEARLLAAAGRGIYDVDDALGAEPLRWRPWLRARVWAAGVAAADVVIVGNDHLATQAARVAPSARIHVVPSCVESADYPLITPGDDEPARALWIGSPSTERHLAGLTDALLELHRRLGLRVSVVSGAGGDLGALETIVDRIAWHPGVWADLPAAHLGLMPLPDTPFERGKCAYKLVQYGAAGLPAVASPVGANVLAAERLGALTATATAEWVEAVTTLVTLGASERAALAARSRTAVDRHYSYAAWADAWQGLVGGP